jgi:hypothetical protein
MRQDVELLWRLAVAVEAAERGGKPNHARELPRRFNRAVERQPQQLRIPANGNTDIDKRAHRRFDCCQSSRKTAGRPHSKR